MDLAKFAKLPPENGGAFLKFTPTDNIKIVRFCYRHADDIKCRQKMYDPATKKVIWDTPEGKWTMQLKVAVYKSKTEFEMMTWDRSARFGADVLMPLFEAAGGDIVDTVYKITCAKAGTLDATFSFFPLRDSDSYAMPTLSAETEAEEVSAPEVQQSAPEPAPVRQEQEVHPTPTQAAPKTARKRFWEED